MVLTKNDAKCGKCYLQGYLGSNTQKVGQGSEGMGVQGRCGASMGQTHSCVVTSSCWGMASTSAEKWVTNNKITT